jgi:hypothetical protein
MFDLRIGTKAYLPQVGSTDIEVFGFSLCPSPVQYRTIP